MSSYSQGSADLAPVTDHWDAATITDEKEPARLTADSKGLGRAIEDARRHNPTNSWLRGVAFDLDEVDASAGDWNTGVTCSAWWTTGILGRDIAHMYLDSGSS